MGLCERWTHGAMCLCLFIQAFPVSKGTWINCSTAQVIEALQLAQSLSAMHQEQIPSLQDLKDAAITCMGYGNQAELMEALWHVRLAPRWVIFPKVCQRQPYKMIFIHS